ncbi:MAG: ComF family protein [Coriobacteriales bacterium]|jgi:predicted amidophosphoribosyltransferase|nr:ComF family protein [Coriobacteriales bacterium]
MSSLLDEALEGVLDTVWLTRCVGCEHPGELLCEDCADQLPFINPQWACPRCGAPFGWLVCSECMTVDGPAILPYTAGVSALEFRNTAQRMIIAYKDRDERRLAGILAGMITRALPRGWLAWADALTWIPSDEIVRRRRGFDHMEQIALLLAEQCGRPAVGVLDKEHIADQRGLSRRERTTNSQSSFTVAQQAYDRLRTQAASRNRGVHLILVDDVFTTGATLKAASETLLAAGVGEIRVATVARVC